ncbi:MAG: ATP-binding protein [Planctomycetota bacterium]|nr:ATP-binding protein [Planctomycetota bacterium]
MNRLVISRPGAGVIGVVFPASHDQGVLCRRILEGHARDEGIPSGEDAVIGLVTSELLTNAIDHGGGGGAHTFQELGSDVRVRSKLTVSSSGWILEVSDRGGGDPEELRAFLDPDGLPDLEDERGRGFFLLASSVDSLTVEANPEGDGLTFKAERRYDSAGES